jgi:hypothetical protein
MASRQTPSLVEDVIALGYACNEPWAQCRTPNPGTHHSCAHKRGHRGDHSLKDPDDPHYRWQGNANPLPLTLIELQAEWWQTKCPTCDRGVVDVPGPRTAEICPTCHGNSSSNATSWSRTDSRNLIRNTWSDERRSWSVEDVGPEGSTMRLIRIEVGSVEAVLYNSAWKINSGMDENVITDASECLRLMHAVNETRHAHP